MLPPDLSSALSAASGMKTIQPTGAGASADQVVDYSSLFNTGKGGNPFIARQPAAQTTPQNSSYNPYEDKWAYTDQGTGGTGYLPRIQASDIQNGKFVGGANYGQFSASNMAQHGDNYQTTMNPDGTFRLGVKTGGQNRLDTTYVKQGDSWVPQAQANAHWDTGKGGFGGTLSKVLSATPAGALMNSPLGQKLAPIMSIASLMIPGMQPFALAMNAMNAGVHGDLKGLAFSALPGIGQMAGAGSTLGQIAGGVGAAGQAYGGVKNLQNGNLLGGLAGLAGGAAGAANLGGSTDLGSTLKTLGQGAGVANNLQQGNILDALQGGAGMAGMNGLSQGLGLAGTVQRLMGGGTTQPKQSASAGPSKQQAQQMYAQIQQKLQSMPGQPVPPQVQQMMQKLQQVMGGPA